MNQDRAEVTNENVDPSARLNAEAAVNAFARAIQSSLNVCFPACIYSYDKDKDIAEVLPLVKKIYYKGSPDYLLRPTYQVRIQRIHFGGFLFWIPPMVGDTGWVIASDRNTEFLKKDGALTASVLEKDRDQSLLEGQYQQDPNTLNFHEFKDGVFIPDNWGRVELERYKDASTFEKERTLYIGTRFDTKDDIQEGKDYEKKDSCSIVLRRESEDGSDPPSVVIANSNSTDEDRENAMIELKERKVNIAALKKLGEGESSVVSIENERLEISNRDNLEDPKKFAAIQMKNQEVGIYVKEDEEGSAIYMTQEDIIVSTKKNLYAETENGSLGITEDAAWLNYGDDKIVYLSDNCLFLSNGAGSIVINNDGDIVVNGNLIVNGNVTANNLQS